MGSGYKTVMRKLLLIFTIIIIAGVVTGLLFSLERNPENNLTDPEIPVQEQELPEGAFEIRGIIEGFYGTPWTNEQRKNMFSFMKLNHFNTYVYAPKDDPFQRSRWWELYPSSNLDPLKELVKVGKDNQISFVYSISPGIPQPLSGQKLTQKMIDQSLLFSSENDYNKLFEKILQLKTAGVNTFMLSFDDVEHFLRTEDQKIYGDNFARAHIELANRLWTEGKENNPAFDLWFVPTIYYGLEDNTYWQEIRNGLNPQIKVIWTGAWVLAEEITSVEADQVTGMLGRKPLVWDNFPVNDYTYVVDNSPRLILGPLANRSRDLSRHTSGYLANPMIQAESSKIPLATTGEYLWNPLNYEPDKSLNNAVIQASGQTGSQPLQKFCSYSSSSILNGNKGHTGFTSLATSFWREYKPGKSSLAESKLREELTLLSSLFNEISQNSNNPALLKEIEPWLSKLSKAGHVGLSALDYLDIYDANPLKEQTKTDLEAQLQDLKSNRSYIGEEVILFIEDCLKF